MTYLAELYKCNICGNVVEITHKGVGALVCCDEAMKLLEEKYPERNDAHYAHIENIDEITKKIHFNHPMTPEHYIEFIEVICNECGSVQRQFLKPGDTPQATFKTCSDDITAREYCNLHGLWQSKK